jgi:hypothetical protein
MEALAGRGELLWLFGSHGRNKDCEVRENRQRVLVLRRDGGQLVESRRLESDEASWSSSADRCLAEHFAAPAPPGAAELCAAIVEAARRGTPARCEVLNIEGAVDLGAEGLFVGLRAPLVGGKAALLRVVEGAATLRFDRVSFLDLGRRGIRGLTREGDTLYLIAGPPSDREEAHALFRVPAGAATSGGPARPEAVGGALPTSSEGLVIEGRHAHIVIDGAYLEDDEDACERPSRQRRIPLSAAAR